MSTQMASAPKGSYPYPLNNKKGKERLPVAPAAPPIHEMEPVCSPELAEKLANDEKKTFKVVYEDRECRQKHVVTITAETKIEALTKFKKAFSVALVTSEDNEADRRCADKFTTKKPYRWDRSTEPAVYSEEEFNILKVV